MASADVLRLDGVGKAFDARDVLVDVSLAVRRGATTAVVGESGSGKTTLLQLINGLLRPDHGRVEVFGGPVPEAGAEHFRRRIGYAVQGAALFPHLTCRANVVLLAQLQGWAAADIEQRFSQLLADMGLAADVAERYPHEVSGGQQQRLGLCRALMLKPELMLLDEPFSAVDPITRVGIYEEFERVRAASGVSSVLVTHDMREAVRLADQILILREGRVAQCAPTEEVVSAPADDYVEMLVRKQL